MLIGRHVTKDAAPNVHQMNGAAYMLGKILYNFCRNILGVQFWTNTLEHSLGKPMYQMQLPPRLRIGAITQIGIYEMSPRLPAQWVRRQSASLA